MRQRLAAARPGNLIVYVGFFAILAFFAVALQDRGFLTPDNFANIARQTAMVSIMAFGMTYVLSAGEIDLSIGAVVGLTALVCAVLLRDDLPVVVAVAGAMGVGIGVGLANGLLTTKLRIPSFLVTLGMMSIVTGVARVLTDLEAVPITDKGFAFVFGSGSVGPIPVLLIWTAVALVVAHVVFRRTPFGRQVLATGGNRVAARYSGIRTDRIAIAALRHQRWGLRRSPGCRTRAASRASATYGETDLMMVIAATVIGGTSMFGAGVVSSWVPVWARCSWACLQRPAADGPVRLGAAHRPGRDHHPRRRAQLCARPARERRRGLTARTPRWSSARAHPQDVRRGDRPRRWTSPCRRGEVHGLIGKNGSRQVDPGQGAQRRPPA
ncbi:MAG: ABC transporter permease [Chloroflexota bacterium]